MAKQEEFRAIISQSLMEVVMWLLMHLLSVGAVAGNVLTVTADGSGEYSRISDALWDAGPGSLVLVEGGTYDDEAFPWFVGADVTIEAAAGSRVDVVLPDDAPTDVYQLIPINRGRVQVVGLTFIEGPNAAPSKASWFSVAESGFLLMERCEFKGVRRPVLTTAALTDRSTYAELHDVEIELVDLPRNTVAIRGC